MNKLLIAFAILGVASASCPNKCSGHGACNLYDKCACQPNWSGADCSGRKCAYGVSWVATADHENAPAGGDMGGRHAYTECSSKGICDSSSGEGPCFDGYEGKGCRRQSCPNDCSGHGRCIYNRGVSGDYLTAASGVPGAGDNNHAKFSSQTWDTDKTRQCSCDRGWEGYDCSARICPKGDDPLTDCDTRREKDDVQLILIEGLGTEADFKSSDHFFTLTYTDMFGGNYTTYPIQLEPDTTCSYAAHDPADWNEGWVTAGDCFVGTAGRAETALKALPNHAVPTVSVSDFNPTRCDEEFTNGAYSTDGTAACTAAESVAWGILVTFSSAFTSGKQSTLVCDVGAKGSDDMPSSQPRMAHAGEANNKGIQCGVFHVGAAATEWAPGASFTPITNGNTYGLAFPSNATNGAGSRSAFDFFTTSTVGSSWATVDGPKDDNTYKEASTCANRGSCDASAGTCECFDGHTGEACGTQTTFF
jgi:hypothetical protein